MSGFPRAQAGQTKAGKGSLADALPRVVI